MNMKQKFTLITFLLVLFIEIAFFNQSHSQQISPVDLIMSPDKFKGALTASGNGNANNLSSFESAGVSAQGAAEFVVGTHESKKKGNLISFPLIVRYNLLNSSRIFQRDTFNVRNMTFMDNNQTINIGFRVRNLRDIGDDKYLLSFLTDYSYRKFSIVDPSGGNLQFETHSFMLGFHTGFLMNTNVATIGITLTPNVNYLLVDNVDPQAFKQAISANGNVANQYLGMGGRFLFQFNDFSIFFDVKQYIGLDSGSNVPDLTDGPVIMFGGNATGSVLKFKKGTSGN
jgi:hypothetical protein